MPDVTVNERRPADARRKFKWFSLKRKYFATCTQARSCSRPLASGIRLLNVCKHNRGHRRLFGDGLAIYAWHSPCYVIWASGIRGILHNLK